MTWEELTVILFPLEGQEARLAAATLRPETIFAVTNLWINPTTDYAEIRLDNKENWIVSPEGAKKLSEQLHDVKTLRRFKGEELIGKKVSNPLKSGAKLIILPAEFVDPKNATGIVYSVPAHAPFDYIALKDLQYNDKMIEKYHLKKEELDEVKPIPLITVAGFGEFPAIDVVEKMKIRDQKDPHLIEATKEVYRNEFHRGRLNANAGKYEGKLVTEVKQDIVKELEARLLSSRILDLPEKVVCRCLTECIVKVLSDQWFLKYSDPQWKKLAHECVDSASIYPENARQWYHDVIDWLRDWPCARRVGLGTPLPWSPGWIVETLSDSTIYTSFYTINSVIKENGVKAESLTEALFDYVLLGEGKIDELVKQTGVDSKVIEQMRNEFLYWYPVNLRNSAKELIPNHLTFFIFQHVAFFPKNLWPTAISVNGMMMNEGVKMSKSKGNVITLEHALNEYGSDALRAALVNGAEAMDDLDWREKSSRDIQRKIASLPDFIAKARLQAKQEKSNSESLEQQIDLWFESRVQRRIERTVSNLNELKTKSAFQEAFFNYWNDIRYYFDRSDNPKENLVSYALDTWLKLLAPFIPFTAEELNFVFGQRKLISLSKFPVVEQAKIHESSELEEQTLLNLVEDAKKITRVLKSKPSKLFVYVSQEWTYPLMLASIESKRKGRKISDVLNDFFASNPSIPKNLVAEIYQKISKSLNDLGQIFLESFERNSSKVSEIDTYKNNRGYLERELGIPVTVQRSDSDGLYDPKRRSSMALPFRPALYFE